MSCRAASWCLGRRPLTSIRGQKSRVLLHGCAHLEQCASPWCVFGGIMQRGWSCAKLRAPRRRARTAPQVEAKLGHLDPYFAKLAKAMVTWVAAWRMLNPEPEPAAAPSGAAAAASTPAAAAAPPAPAAAAASAPAPAPAQAAPRDGGAGGAAPPAAAAQPAHAPGAPPRPGVAPAAAAPVAATPSPAALVKLANGHAAGLAKAHHAAVANGVLANGRA